MGSVKMSGDRVFNKSELLQNDGEDGNKLWVLIQGKVYDVTDFKHPGGKEILMDDIGVDRYDNLIAFIPLEQSRIWLNTSLEHLSTIQLQIKKLMVQKWSPKNHL